MYWYTFYVRVRVYVYEWVSEWVSEWERERVRERERERESVCVSGCMYMYVLYMWWCDASKEGSWYDLVCVGCSVTGLIYYLSAVEPFVCVCPLCMPYTHTCMIIQKISLLSLSLSLFLSLFLFPLTKFKDVVFSPGLSLVSTVLSNMFKQLSYKLVITTSW